MRFPKRDEWLPLIVCLLAAAFFWVYVMNEQNPQVENSYTIPVETRNLDRALVATNVPSRVRLVVRMSRTDMATFRSENVKAYVDLSNLEQGDYPNTPIYVTVPGNATILEQSQKYFNLNIDTYAVRSLEGTVEFFGNPEVGFTAEKKSLVPDQITIAGAKTKVDSADRAVISVNLSGRDKDFEEYNAVNVLDAEGNTVSGIDVMPSRARVSVTVEEDQRTGNIPFKVETTGTPADGYKIGKITVSPAQATVKAPGSYFKENESITLPVDVSGATATVTKRYSLAKPENGIIIPGSVTVTVEITQQ